MRLRDLVPAQLFEKWLLDTTSLAIRHILQQWYVMVAFNLTCLIFLLAPHSAKRQFVFRLFFIRFRIFSIKCCEYWVSSDMEFIFFSTTLHRHSQFLPDLVRERLVINVYLSTSMVPRPILLPTRRSPPMFAAKPQVHLPRRRLLIAPTVATSPHHHLQRCHSPYLVFPSSSLVRQAHSPSRALPRLTLNSRILYRLLPTLERSVSLKAAVQNVASSADLLVLGSRPHIPPTLVDNIRAGDQTSRIFTLILSFRTVVLDL